MPASITIALVASSPKVSGSRIEIPASGPMPGNTPTSVPTRQPRNAYHSTAGCSATVKPSQSASKFMLFLRRAPGRKSGLPLFGGSEPEYPLFERRLQRLAEYPPCDDGQADTIGRRIVQRLALDHGQQHEHEQRHRHDKAERLVGYDRPRRDDHD